MFFYYYFNSREELDMFLVHFMKWYWEEKGLNSYAETGVDVLSTMWDDMASTHHCKIIGNIA